MCTKWTLATLLIAALAAPGALAEPARSGADPATKTLPASASDIAKARAFGVQGAAMRAAHQAARAAAAQEARAAVAQAQPAGAVRPSATAAANASTTGIDNGFDRAAAGAGNGKGSAHRRP
jgi:hypothetical protein